jgi:hypothetical protein
MIPLLIILDPKLLDFYGEPSKEAIIFEQFVKVHPHYEQRILEGLNGMFGDIFTVITINEYNASLEIQETQHGGN